MSTSAVSAQKFELPAMPSGPLTETQLPQTQSSSKGAQSMVDFNNQNTQITAIQIDIAWQRGELGNVAMSQFQPKPELGGQSATNPAPAETPSPQQGTGGPLQGLLAPLKQVLAPVMNLLQGLLGMSGMNLGPATHDQQAQQTNSKGETVMVNPSSGASRRGTDVERKGASEGFKVEEGQDYTFDSEGNMTLTRSEWDGYTAQKSTNRGDDVYTLRDESGQFKGNIRLPETAEDEAVYTYQSPLMVDLNGDGVVNTTQVDNSGKQFDIDADGEKERVGWVAPEDGIMVIDADGDGVYGEDATEVLGNYTDTDGDGKANAHANGFEALNELIDNAEPMYVNGEVHDIKADGRITPDEFEHLGVKVQDGNGNLVDVDMTMDLGYTNLNSTDALYEDSAGNQHRQVGDGMTIDGQESAVHDVWVKSEER